MNLFKKKWFTTNPDGANIHLKLLNYQIIQKRRN